MSNRVEKPFAFRMPKPGASPAANLTRRELAAYMAMQGLLAREPNGYQPVAIDAVRYADALIKELEKE